MITEKMFPELPPRDRLEMLESNCLRTEERTYQKAFSDEEISLFKDEMSEAMILLSGIKKSFSEVKKDFKAKMEPIEKKINGLLDYIKHRERQVTEQVFLYDFQEDGMMAQYNSDGELVGTRRLTPAERQTRIMSVVHRTGTEK
jgi:hypothetical protein